MNYYNSDKDFPLSQFTKFLDINWKKIWFIFQSRKIVKNNIFPVHYLRSVLHTCLRFFFVQELNLPDPSKLVTLPHVSKLEKLIKPRVDQVISKEQFRKFVIWLTDEPDKQSIDKKLSSRFVGLRILHDQLKAGKKFVDVYEPKTLTSRFNQLHYVRRENHHLLPNPVHVSRQISQSPRKIPNSPRKKYFPTSRRATTTTTAAPVIPNQHISRRFNQQSLSQIKKKLSQTPTTCSPKIFPSARDKILSNPQQRRTLPKQQRSTLPKHLPTHKKNKNNLQTIRPLLTTHPHTTIVPTAKSQNTRRVFYRTRSAGEEYFQPRNGFNALASWGLTDTNQPPCVDISDFDSTLSRLSRVSSIGSNEENAEIMEEFFRIQRETDVTMGIDADSTISSMSCFTNLQQTEIVDDDIIVEDFSFDHDGIGDLSSSDAGSVKSDSCIDYCTNHQQKASCSKNFEKVENNSHNTSSTKINAKDFSFTVCETKYYEHQKSDGIIAHRKINSDSIPDYSRPYAYDNSFASPSPDYTIDDTPRTISNSFNKVYEFISTIENGLYRTYAKTLLQHRVTWNILSAARVEDLMELGIPQIHSRYICSLVKNNLIIE